MPKDVPENLPPDAPAPPPAPWVRLQWAGQDGPVTCAVPAHVVLIGSRRDCHLPVTHPEVSKTHCALINTGRGILVRDLISRSGTFLNDQTVRTAPLTPGAVLRTGPVIIGIEFPAAVTPPQAAPLSGEELLHLPSPITIELHGEVLQRADNAFIIGRRNTADVVIDTPDTSLAHALVFSLDGRPAIHDLGSRSGTWVNGERVELCWLPNGAQVEIGGDQFVVRWDEPAVQQATDAPAVAVEAAPACAPTLIERPASAPNGPATLDELEQMIAGVQGRIATARSRLDERARELDQRCALLERQQAEAEARRTSLAQLEAELASRKAELAKAQQEYEQRCGALDQRTHKLGEEEAALGQRRAELEVTASKIEEERKALDGQRAAVAEERSHLDEGRAAFEREKQALDQARESLRAEEEQYQARVAEMNSQTARLAEQQAALAESAAQARGLEAQVAEREAALKSALGEMLERESGLAKREQEVQAREAALAAQQAQNAELDGRIREFKTALMRAGELISSATPPECEAGAQPANQTPGEVAPPRVGARPSSPEPAEAGGDAELPAPIVDQPLFASSTFPPANWHPRLRERYRVLRRMSRKSDVELAKQVWAERERVLAGPEAAPRENGKRKRRFWGN